MPSFTHLHVHTQYSLLDGAASIEGLVEKAKNDGMKALAITDHGNMFGVFHFVKEAEKQKIKPIIGCEFYVVADRHKKSFTIEVKDVRHHQLLLAKTEEGYKNLIKLCSLGFIDGHYSKYPRIDKELILKYHKGLIATTCCIGAEIPQTILKKGAGEAEKSFKWWLDLFGEDYYIELQRHNLQNIDNTGISQEDINRVLLGWSEKHNVKIIATNDSHYVERKDWKAHDILLCVNTGDKQSTPIGDGKDFRFGFPNDQFYFKTQVEMNELFSDIPQALDYTNEIVDKVYTPKLKRNVLLPNFALPQGFTAEDDYLRHLAYEGAHRLYPQMTTELEQRLNFELEVVRKMGFAGYFLIVQDFCDAARKLGVSVGPGRGSAAGSAIAYCIGITNIDPIRYKLLFERFLNPERISMPDIDIDFDDKGRDKVIEYVVKKYGRNQVAQIVTYGTMAAKSSIRDVARVLELPLGEADQLAKLVPAAPGISLEKAYKDIPELAEIRRKSDLRARTLELAKELEGSIRNTGIHAAGIIIAPDDITEYIPVCTSKESDLLVTQFEGKDIEEAGMLKMDFLGLKTLSIIQDAIHLIRENYGKIIDPDKIPLDDQNTYKLYQRGDTVGTFQFESDGMRGYLRDLKPNNIEDLIAMNALYRPGAMDDIPSYINRKNGKEKYTYPHPIVGAILEPTYGVIVYQEQVMLIVQQAAGFTMGQADTLRKAMGKKNMTLLETQREQFITGSQINGMDKQTANDLFTKMAKFGGYGFNRSHSAAYSVLAYQTAYLKANYSAEYMSSVLTHNMGNIDQITFFMSECNRMGIPVLGPDVNESSYNFSVNKKGQIRFGLAAIKGVGQAAADGLISERQAVGNFTGFFDLIRRVNLRTVNKKTIEALTSAGAFDSFGYHRSQYFFQESPSAPTLIEKAIRFGTTHQEQKISSQHSLFGGMAEVMLPEPNVPKCESWEKMALLAKEKEVTGMYLSGHPLDDYKLEIQHLCKNTISQLNNDINMFRNKDVCFAGMVTEVIHKTSKNGKPYASFKLEDYTDTIQLFLFAQEYIKCKNYLNKGWTLFFKGIVQQRMNSEQLDIRINSVELLSDIKDKFIKGITLKFSLANISEELVRDINTYMEASNGRGKCQLRFQIEDSSENLKITLPARKSRIELSRDFFKWLEKENISFQLS